MTTYKVVLKKSIYGENLNGNGKENIGTEEIVLATGLEKEKAIQYVDNYRSTYCTEAIAAIGEYDMCGQEPVVYQRVFGPKGFGF